MTRGEKTVEILKQDQYVPLPLEKEVQIIYAAVNGHLDDLPTESLARFEQEFFAFVEKEYPDVGHSIATTKQLEDSTAEKLKTAVLEFKERFVASLKD